jgi:hypothetical protein
MGYNFSGDWSAISLSNIRVGFNTCKLVIKPLNMPNLYRFGFHGNVRKKTFAEKKFILGRKSE